MYNETYHNPDRTCGYKDILNVEAKCEAYINFQCTENFMLLKSAPKETQKQIYVTLKEGYESPYVGELTSHWWSTGIFIKNGSPWKILHNDITSILNQSGYTLSDKQKDSVMIIEADIKLLDVRTETGWTKSTTQAIVKFDAALLDDKGKYLWFKLFTGEHKIDISYAYLKDYEETLGQAYCNALNKFSDAIQSSEFYDKLN